MIALRWRRDGLTRRSGWFGTRHVWNVDLVDARVGLWRLTFVADGLVGTTHDGSRRELVACAEACTDWNAAGEVLRPTWARISEREREALIWGDDLW